LSSVPPSGEAWGAFCTLCAIKPLRVGHWGPSMPPSGEACFTYRLPRAMTMAMMMMNQHPSLIGETVAQINKKLRLFDALPWSSFTDTQRVSILLGNPPPPSSGNTRRRGCRSVSPCSIHTRRSSGPSSSPYYPHLLRSLKMTPPKMAPKHGNPHQPERRERAHAHTHTHTHTHAHTYTHTHTP